jgi:hypothetical protein
MMKLGSRIGVKEENQAKSGHVPERNVFVAEV